MAIRTFGTVAASVCLVMAAGSANAAACFSEPNFTSLGNTFSCSAGTDISTITGPGNGFTRLNEGNGWHGEFVHGAPLYYDNGTSGPVTDVFSSPFPAFYLNFDLISSQANLTGPYTATVSAYYLGNFVGSDSYNGNNQLGPEGTIPIFDFSAFGSSLIDELVYSTTNDSAGFAIGINFGTVPEPAAWVMMLVGLGGLGAALRGSRRQRSVLSAV